MAERTAGSIRARVRAEIIEEIKEVSRRHIAENGASLSLRAVARDMEMVSSAIYRYFVSRDELLTALIIDAYNAMGAAAEEADAAVVDRTDLLGRWLAVAHSLREWALARPHEYALIYGSPVPGYAAPQDTVEPSIRPVMVLGAILGQAQTNGCLPDGSPLLMPPALRAEIAKVAQTVSAEVGDAAMARALIAWTELFGALSFELFGRLNKTIDERYAWFDYQVRVMAGFVGLA